MTVIKGLHKQYALARELLKGLALLTHGDLKGGLQLEELARGAGEDEERLWRAVGGVQARIESQQYSDESMQALYRIQRTSAALIAEVTGIAGVAGVPSVFARVQQLLQATLDVYFLHRDLQKRLAQQRAVAEQVQQRYRARSETLQRAAAAFAQGERRPLLVPLRLLVVFRRFVECIYLLMREQFRVYKNADQFLTLFCRKPEDVLFELFRFDRAVREKHISLASIRDVIRIQKNSNEELRHQEVCGAYPQELRCLVYLESYIMDLVDLILFYEHTLAELKEQHASVQDEWRRQSELVLEKQFSFRQSTPRSESVITQQVTPPLFSPLQSPSNNKAIHFEPKLPEEP